jgi:hypothetical protein
MHLDFYAAHGELSDPGKHAQCIDRLPGDVAAMAGVVRGLLLHDYYGGELYGQAPVEFVAQSRTTLPVEERLTAVLGRDSAPLDTTRAPFERSVGTCRDFALLLCAMLRQHGTPSRVRCGFADYFGGPGWEDHWVTEYWLAHDNRWALADAQLDDAHRRHLGIEFDVVDIPRARFRLAWQAWRACRAGADPSHYGHGEATGLWFVEVNLARDLNALSKRETSPWDSWRNAKPADRLFDEARLAQGDHWAALGEHVDERDFPGAGDLALACRTPPPWKVPV